MKQTAVEWLFQKLWDEPKDKLTWYGMLKQAKEMEKQQIIEAYRKGVEEDVYVNPLKTGTQYYNETFKTKNHD